MILSQCFGAFVTCFHATMSHVRDVLHQWMHHAAIAEGTMGNATSAAHCCDPSELLLAATS